MSADTAQSFMIEAGKDRFMIVTFQSIVLNENRETVDLQDAPSHYLDIRDACTAILLGEAEICHGADKQIRARYNS